MWDLKPDDRWGVHLTLQGIYFCHFPFIKPILSESNKNKDSDSFIDMNFQNTVIL